MSFRHDASVQAAAAGVLAAFVGFASSFAVVLKGLTAVGASPDQAASGLMALAVAMGLSAIWLSLKGRIPVSVAWSTPGAALLATSGPLPGGFAAAVGAFLATGVLLTLAGLWRPLGRWVGAIPTPLASAMLAGVLFGLCLAPVRAIAVEPAMALAIIVTWAAVARISRLYAVPAAVVLTLVLIGATSPPLDLGVADLAPHPALVVPTLDLGAMLGIALPLFIVTMASQNIPGLAVLNVNGYRPDAGPLLRGTGLFSLIAAPFGGHAVNLAAITAALCAGADAHPDPRRRYVAAVVAGAVYVALGLGAGAVTAFVRASPPVLIEAVAGLALLGALAGALVGAMAEPRDREAALVTFVVTASGLTLFGIGAAFWGLVAGGAILALARWRQP